MANYNEWNAQIAAHFTEGIQRGSAVFLSVDDEALQRVGSVMGIPYAEATHDFLNAVISFAVVENEIRIKRFAGRMESGIPRGVGFLVVMVLAASHMAHDAEADLHHRDYFKHLRRLLNLSEEDGRPKGLEIRGGPPAPEEDLWREWNIWLQEVGLLPTARRGEGPQAYVSYPISQALLRRVDRERLRRFFADHHRITEYDSAVVLTRVRRSGHYLTTHLQELLLYQGPREIAVRDAIYDEYLGFVEDPLGSNLRTTQGFSLHSSIPPAGLYRGEDDADGAPVYYLYPRSPRGRALPTLTLKQGDTTLCLRAERSGWFMPWLRVDEKLLTSGGDFPIISPSDLTAVRLPAQTFWILVADPENIDAGTYATWGSVSFGTPFLVICKHDWLKVLERMREEQLIEWRGEPRPLSSNQDWWEVRDCLALSEVWTTHGDDSVNALYDALRPQAKLNVQISGGLRVNDGWLVDYGPEITVVAFPLEADVRIVNAQTDATIYETTCQTKQPITVKWNEPGHYRIDVTCGSESTQRLVKLANWSTLNAQKPSTQYETCVGTSIWRGALQWEVS